ncbi:hypothetical protein B0T24DRAFT_532039, partial [Lasiosphaeria ovina]
DLPDTFGFDKYSLIVHKEFAIDLPRPDGTGTTEAPAVPETNSADITGPPEQQNTTALDMLALAASQPSHPDSNTNATIPTSHDQSSTCSADDTAATTPEAPHFPDSSNDIITTPNKPSRMSLRIRKELSYHEPTKGGGASRPK